MGIPDERIQRLHVLAREAAAGGDADRAREYVRLARRLGERHRIRLPREFRRFSCDACDVYLVPGGNARVRLHSGRVVVTCKECGEIARYPYK